MPGPLAHIRVLDLTRVLAGPFATQVLADLGAEVIKIERPGEGDDTRHWGPPFLDGPEGTRGDAHYFLAANRNKRSVAIDFAQPEGAALVRRLARRAHVLAENFRTGGLAKYGLDFPALVALNPGLVYASVTGFGQTGPMRETAGYDFMIQARAGLMSITGQPDGAPGAEPMKVGVAVADLFTGLYTAIGILAALLHAQRTGEGQHVDAALFDCQLAALANQAQNALAGRVPGRLGNEHPNIVPYRVMNTADGHLVLAVGNDTQFARVCALAGHPEWVADPRYATNASRVERRAEVAAMLAPVFAARTTAAWITALEAEGVPCGPINTIDAALADPQAVARAMVVPLMRPDGTQTRTVAHPIKYSATPPDYRTAPPALGADTDTVLQEMLDLTPDAIAALRKRGVVG